MTDLALRCVKIVGRGSVEHIDKNTQAFSLLSNIEKAKRQLQWEPKDDVDTMIKYTLNMLKKETNDQSKKLKKNFKDPETYNQSGNDKNQEVLEEDEFNPTLAAMEQEIRPQIISTFNALCKDYTKLIKLQNDTFRESQTNR